MAIEMDPAAKMLYGSEPLRKPILQNIIAFLHFATGSQGLDVGCGIGLQTVLLAQAAGPAGHVTGLDTFPSFLETARAIAGEAGIEDQVSFQEGSWDQVPYPDQTFDWVWSMDAAGYAPHEPAQTFKEIIRVVKPGGRVILGFWSSQSLLPGHPALEARLNASRTGIAPYKEGAQPETHYLRTLGWMREAGLENRRTDTFVRSVSAPLSSDVLEALRSLLEMRWGTAETDVSAEDWHTFQRLSQKESADFILNCPDYYAFFTYSVFSGSVPLKSREVNELNLERKAALCYEIRLKGQLSEHWSEWFHGMVMERDGEGNTSLTGPVVDQAALHGILDQVRDIGLTLLSVKLLDE